MARQAAHTCAGASKHPAADGVPAAGSLVFGFPRDARAATATGRVGPWEKQRPKPWAPRAGGDAGYGEPGREGTSRRGTTRVLGGEQAARLASPVAAPPWACNVTATGVLRRRAPRTGRQRRCRHRGWPPTARGLRHGWSARPDRSAPLLLLLLLLGVGPCRVVSMHRPAGVQNVTEHVPRHETRAEACVSPHRT